jgi:hypothetical protein
MQGVVGHPGEQGGGPKKNNWKKGGPRRRRGTSFKLYVSAFTPGYKKSFVYLS